jgi:hypothetical protein
MESLLEGMKISRAWHTATILPDGRVFIVGGLTAGEQVVSTVERFDPATKAFEVLTDVRLTPRVFHSATVLTDGRVLVGGGQSSTGEVLTLVELWDPERGTVETLSPGLSLPRQQHEAILFPDGGELFLGGNDALDQPHQLNDYFDLQEQKFTLTQEAPLPFSLPILLDTVLPAQGAQDVPIDTRLALRFSRPVQVESVNDHTIILLGPQGAIDTRLVPAEEGRLVFVTPHTTLLPDTTYQLEIEGLVDEDGNLVASHLQTFTTVEAVVQGVTDGQGLPLPTDEQFNRAGSQAKGKASAGALSTDFPGNVANPNALQSPWRKLAAFEALPGVTAVAGQVLTLDGAPLVNVTLSLKHHSTTTDSTGRFLLNTHVPAGHHVLIMDGTSANGPGKTYGSFEIGVNLKKGKTRVLPFTLWMPEIDVQHATILQAPSSQAIKVTTSAMPGLEVHIPAHVSLLKAGGAALTSLSITPLSLVQAPFPVLKGTYALFTLQTHGARVVGIGFGLQTPGVRIIFPNSSNLPAKTRVSLLSYDAAGVGWFSSGEGFVSADGQQILPDANIQLTQVLCTIAVGPPGNAPGTGPKPGQNAKDGDPVDLGTGLFVLEKTDLAIPDTIPIHLIRTYRQNDLMMRPFGIGASHAYEWFLIGDLFNTTYVDLVLPDGSRIHYERVNPGTGATDGLFQHAETPTKFFQSTLQVESGLWALRFSNGEIYRFQTFHGWSQAPGALLSEMTDRLGNRLQIIREERLSEPLKGRITKIISPAWTGSYLFV